jgi:hypothetical protein
MVLLFCSRYLVVIVLMNVIDCIIDDNIDVSNIIDIDISNSDNNIIKVVSIEQLQ